MKIKEVLQPRHREEYASCCYRIVVDTRNVTPAMLFSPEYWESHTILKKGDILRCVADDGSYQFDLIIDSQRRDVSKSVKNIIEVSMFPDLTDEVIEAAAERSAAKAAAREAASAAQAAIAQPASPTPSAAPAEAKPQSDEKPALDPNKYSFAKRKEIAKREKMLAKRKEIDERNKARTAERLAAEAAAASGDAA
jgi:hypothetical protein